MSVQITASKLRVSASSAATLAPEPLKTGKPRASGPKCVAEELLDALGPGVAAVGAGVAVVGGGDRGEDVGVGAGVVVGGEVPHRRRSVAMNPGG